MASLFYKLFGKAKDINAELENQFDIEVVEKDKFPIDFDYGTSDFKKQLIYDEYKKIEEPLVDNIMKIETVYIYNGFDGIEAGIFFINTSDKPVELYSVKLGLANRENELLLDDTINFNGEVRIEPKSSFFYEILFKYVNVDDVEGLKVVLPNLNDLNISYTKDIDMENLLDENSLSEETKDFLRERFYDLPALREGEVIIDPVYALGTENGINLIMLIRNGSNKEIVLDSLPIVVSMKEGLPIYIGELDFNKEGFSIGEEQGKLINLQVPKDAMMIPPIENYAYKFSFK